MKETLDIDCNLARMDMAMIHRYLTEESQWAKGISLPLVRKSLKNSLCFGGFIQGNQVAFARVISDYATFANLVDVFVLPQYRGNGYGKVLMQAVVEHPELQGLRRFTLATADAHGLYHQFGFKSLAEPQRFMERFTAEIYTLQAE